MSTIKFAKDFTIITPVFNGEKWIKETIESVLEHCQNYNYEYIVVNDGSNDRTFDILANYHDKIRVIDQENQGEAAAVNRALAQSKGKFVLVVSADDPMRTHLLLQESKKILEADDRIVCVYPDWTVIDLHSIPIRDVIVPEYSETKLIGEFNCVVGPGGVFRINSALAAGGRDARYRFTSDYDFWLRLSRYGSFQRIPGHLAYWREHDESTSISLRGQEMARERIEVIRNFVRANPSLSRSLRNMALGYAYFHAATLVYFDKSIPSRRWILGALAHYPAGIRKFDSRVIIFILLNPFSHSIINFLRRFRVISRVLPNA